MPLSLKAADDSVMTDHFFFSALGKFLVAVEQILDYARHFRGKFPVFFLLSGSFLHFDGILVEVRAAFFFNPRESLFILCSVVNTFGHSADDFHFVYAFHTHTEIFFKEFGADDRTADAHRYRADLQVRFSTHRGNRYRRAGKTQNLFLHVLRNRGIVRFLHFVSVNAECGQAFLRVRCQNRSKIHRARAFRAVESPHRLDRERIHIHRFRAVAPARRYRERDIYARFFEFIFARRRFRYSADCGVRNDYFNVFAV